MIKLDEIQKQALQTIYEQELCYINGEAGTGKSLVIMKATEMLEQDGWNVSRIAFTGKASLKIKGTTIHSWLQPEIQENEWKQIKVIGFQKESFNYKEAVLVDEASMVNQELWDTILKCFKNTFKDKKLVFIGDGNQLEPIGDGTPFLDALNNKSSNVITLQNIYRQNKDNDLLDYIKWVLHNVKVKNTYNNVKQLNVKKMIDIVSKNFKNNQIGCPSKKGEYGTWSINSFIQHKRVLNKELVDKAFIGKKWEKINNKWKLIDTIPFYYGDKVVITRNNFVVEVSNGTTGILVKDGFKEIFNYYLNQMEPVYGFYIDCNELGLKFVPATFMEKHCDLAYALTIHKLQGSEVSNMFFVLTWDQQQSMSMNKKLCYTAITRPTSMLYLITDYEDKQDEYEYQEWYRNNVVIEEWNGDGTNKKILKGDKESDLLL